MLDDIKIVSPTEIEKKSFEIIQNEIGDIQLDCMQAPIIKRVIHTTADFSYLENLCFSENAVAKAISAIKNGASIVTDTKMAASGINSKALAKFGGEVYCFMNSERAISESSKNNITRASICMDIASELDKNCIFAIGNAPTALIRLYELIAEKRIKPEFIIGVPVGFVNVVESKELIIKTDIPYIVARGRKGGSNVAAAICNALIYMSN